MNNDRYPFFIILSSSFILNSMFALQRYREHVTLFLIALLPFHAFLVTVGTKWMEGPNHAPAGMLVLWKETLLGTILLMVLVELAKRLAISGQRLAFFTMDWIDGCIIALLVLAVIVSSFELRVTSFVYGFKYDFIPLIMFLILRRVEWTQEFRDLAIKIITIVGGIIAAYGIISFFLPGSFFTWLGYSDLHSLYIPNGPLAAFQHLESLGIRRIQSVMSGPNQLGLWLLLPFSVGCVMWVKKPTFGWTLFILLTGFAIDLTFSRAAWIAASVIMIVLLIRYRYYKLLGGFITIGILAVIMTLIFLPSILLRATSNREHFARPVVALQTMIAHPFGLGLGSAGPATNRTSDACVHLSQGDDASWAKDHPNLCVYIDDEQVQPADRTCICPFLPENWYIQMGVELGWLGFTLYLLLIGLITRTSYLATSKFRSIFGQLTFMSFLGISIAALFLHAWEDSAIAYTVWILLAALLPSKKEEDFR